MQFGRTEPNQAAKRIGQGKVIRPLFFSMPAAMISAAFSASMKNGIGQVFLSVIRERTNPGQMTFSCMFSLAKRIRIASPYAFTQALDALYDGHPASP